MESAFRALLDEEFEAGKTYRKSDSDWLEKKWEGFKKLSQLGVTKETALEIGNSFFFLFLFFIYLFFF